MAETAMARVLGPCLKDPGLKHLPRCRPHAMSMSFSRNPLPFPESADIGSPLNRTVKGQTKTT